VFYDWCQDFLALGFKGIDNQLDVTLTNKAQE
jgi:hypothetical protein